MPVHKPVWLWAGTLVVGAVLVLVGVLIGRATAPEPVPVSGDGAPRGTPTPAAPPAAPPSPTTPAPAGQGPSPTTQGPSAPSVSVTGGPGEDVLAAAGSGDDILLFTASNPDWAVETMSQCAGQDDFVLTVRRGDQVVARLADTGGSGAVTVEEPGGHVLEVGGSCSWTIRAVS